MSANLLAGVEPSLAYGSIADGVITSSTPKDGWKNVAAWPITSEAFAKNQTMHIGLSAKWHGAAATSGTAWASVKYVDAAGNINNANVKIDGITTEWKRFSLSAVVPSGMHLVDFHFSGDKLDAAYDATSFVLSYGSPVPLAMAEATAADVNVGGRNLLLDTGTFTINATSGNCIHSVKGDLQQETYCGANVRKNTKVANTWAGFAWNVLDCKPSEIYTFSFWVKGNCDKINAFFYGPDGYIKARVLASSNNYTPTEYGDGAIIFNVSDTWTRVWVTYEIDPQGTAGPKYILIRDDLSTTGKDYYLAGAKLELGNIATDWTPAPEDVATDIAEAADKAGDALDKANANEEKLKDVSKALLSVEENIKALVTGANGSSLMTQTTNGWTFDISKIQQTVSDSANAIANLDTNLDSTNALLDKTRDLLNDVTKKTAYINFATDDSGNPCIELGKNDNPFKLRITNTSMDFMQGSQRIAYLSNHQLYIESSVITDSIYIGSDHTYIWKKRANNHLGLRYV